MMKLLAVIVVVAVVLVLVVAVLAVANGLALQPLLNILVYDTGTLQVLLTSSA